MRHRCIAALVGVAAVVAFCTPIEVARGGATPPRLTVHVVEKGSSSLLGIRKAKNAVPVGRLDSRDRALVQGVFKNLSIYRRLPEVRCESDPRVTGYFVANPEVAVGLWRALDVSQVRMTKTGPGTFEADAGDGSRGLIRTLYHDDQQEIVYCDGAFVNPVSKHPIKARAVLHFRATPERSTDGREFVRHGATMFVSLPNHAVETVARVIAPVSNRLADKNFEEISLFIRMMSVAMQEQPGWLEEVADRMDGVPEQSHQSLLETAAVVHADTLRRRGQAPSHLPTRSAERPTPARR